MPEVPRVYWDANVFLSYVNEYADRVQEIEALLEEGKRGEIELLTSTVSVVEVAFGAVEQKQAALSPRGRGKDKQAVGGFFAGQDGRVSRTARRRGTKAREERHPRRLVIETYGRGSPVYGTQDGCRGIPHLRRAAGEVGLESRIPDRKTESFQPAPVVSGSGHHRQERVALSRQPNIVRRGILLDTSVV